MLTDMDKERLGHIQWAIENIERFTQEGRRAFDSSLLIQHATLYNLTVVGEAVRCLTSELKFEFPHIPWHNIIGMRNVVTHVYFNVKLDTVWRVIEEHLPYLKQQVEAIIAADARESP